jgi:hypothetical protein
MRCLLSPQPLSPQPRGAYELAHLIPLKLGGAFEEAAEPWCALALKARPTRRGRRSTLKWMRAASCALLVLVACSGSQRPPELGDFLVRSAEAGVDASGAPTFGPLVAPSDNPTTCEQAAQWQSYVGCDYWPTVVANDVWSIFDFTVVVANAGASPRPSIVTSTILAYQSITAAFAVALTGSMWRLRRSRTPTLPWGARRGLHLAS